MRKYRISNAPIPSIFSIYAGITGIGGAALVGVDTSSALSALGAISIVGPLAKFAVAFPLSYHYLGKASIILF